MPDEPATPPSSRAHEFDSTCNCGDCLADRGIEPAPATPPVQQSSRVRDWTVGVRMARDFYPTFKAFLGLHPELCLYRAEELTRAATPPEQESSRVEAACPTCGGPVVTMGEGMTHWYRPTEPAQPPTEQGPTRGDEELREAVARGDLDAIKRLRDPAHTEQGDLAAEARDDLAARLAAEADRHYADAQRLREDGDALGGYVSTVAASSFRKAAEMARDHARATSGTGGEA